MNVQGSAPNLEPDRQSDSVISNLQQELMQMRNFQQELMQMRMQISQYFSITSKLQQDLMYMRMQNAELQATAKWQNDQLTEYSFQLQAFKNGTDSMKVYIHAILSALENLPH